MIYKSHCDRAVSDVIGTVMMVAITFLLAFTIGGFILGEYDSAEPDVYATVEFEENEDHSVEVVWTKRGTADSIQVFNQTETKTIDSFGESVTMGYGSDSSDISVVAQANKGEYRTFLTKYNVPEVKSSIYAESSTCDDFGPSGDPIDPYCGSTVVFNGTEITSERGVNIFAFDSQGRFHSHAYYDTHNGDDYRPPTYSLKSDGTPQMNAEVSCTGCTEQRAYNHITQNIPSGHYIVIVGDDQPGQVNKIVGTDAEGNDITLDDEYARMGGQFSNDDKLEYRDSWILATKKTVNGPIDEYDRIFEKHAPRGSQSGVPVIKAYFVTPLED